MPLGVVNLFQIGGLDHSFYPLLQRDNNVIAGHDRHRFELQAFRQMHGADGHMPGLGLHMLIQNPARHTRLFDGSFGAVQFAI